MPVIGFDGLHRAGKGTAIANAIQELKEYGFFGVVVKGFGSRKGATPRKANGTVNVYDPPTDRRTNNYEKLKEYPVGDPKAYALWVEASKKLTSETAELLRVGNENGVSGLSDNGYKPVLLVDRSWASRLFFELIYRNGRHTDVIINDVFSETYKPHATIILNVTLEHLQKRFTPENLTTVQGRFRYENNRRNYEYMQELIVLLRNEEGVTIIDGNPKVGTYQEDSSLLYSKISPIVLEQVHAFYCIS